MNKLKKQIHNIVLRVAIAVITLTFAVGVVAVANPTVFALTVAGSFATPNGGGNHAHGTTVHIHAGNRLGYVFASWYPPAAVANATIPNTTLVMPQSNLTVTATWQPIFLPVGTQWVSVVDSWLPHSQNGEGARLPGTWVTINAGTRPGHFFWGWMTSHNIELANPHSPVTSFLMPHSHVEVHAVWVPQDWAGAPGQDFIFIPGQGWWHPIFGFIGWDLPPGWGIPPVPPGWGWPQLPNLPWLWQVGPNWHHRQSGGVVMAYGGGIGNFPASAVAAVGTSISFQLRVERIAPIPAEGTTTLVGQWQKDGINHGNAFPIFVNADGIAVVNLNLPNVDAEHAGSYVLRVATMMGNATTFVDVSRPLRLSVQNPVETFTHDTPDYRIPRAPRPSLPGQ